MIKLLGPPPQELLFRADQRVYSQLFDGQGVFRHQNLIPDGRFDFESKTPHLSGDDKTLFINFAKRMLAWMPEERATAKELLNDPWLQHTED
jgi:serine/threonine-protein kinase SRPK3